MPANQFGFSFLGPGDTSSDFGVERLMIQQMLARVRTAIECQVISCTNSGGVSAVGFVTVQPIVCQLDGQGNAVPHKPLYNLCYFRLQGGTNAVICDPKPGDIGMAVICDRDISSVKANASNLWAGTPGPTNIVNPGTLRRHNMADGVFYSGNLNKTPTSYLQFDNDGNINIVVPSSQTITVNGGTVKVHGANIYQWDAHGYGQRVTWTGGSNYTVDNYTSGATVTTNTLPINPPGPP